MNKIRIKQALLSASCVALMSFTPPSADAQEKAAGMTLPEVVSSGIMTNPEYGIVAASRRATDEELNQAKALFLPSIDFRGDTGYEYTDSPTTRAGTGDDHESMWRYDSSLTLTQMLFDGWNAKYETERQKRRVQSSAHRVRETAELVGLSIVEHYLEVMRQRELLAIAQENLKDHEDILKMISDGVDAGRSTRADLEQAKARLASAKAQESTIREQLRVAESEFHKEVGEFPKDLEMPSIPVDALSEDVDQEVNEALANSPTLDIYKADVDVSYAEYKGTGSTMYPQLNLQLNGRQGDDLSGVEGRNRSASALLVMNWNLYRGGADIARIREFKHRHQQNKEELADIARSLEDDVRQTWASMVSAGERANEFNDQAEANTEVVRAYKDQFELDRRTLLDVLDAQNELFVSRSNAINAEYLEVFSVFRLLALKGKLLPTLGVAYPRESEPITIGYRNEER